jgi:hypothetical protein
VVFLVLVLDRILRTVRPTTHFAGHARFSLVLTDFFFGPFQFQNIVDVCAVEVRRCGGEKCGSVGARKKKKTPAAFTLEAE